MSEFYTNVQVMGSKILYRGFKNGQRVQSRIAYSPYLYSKTNEHTEFKTLFGDSLKQHSFQTNREARDFIDTMKGANRLYGDNRWNYSYIAENFRGELAYDYNKLNILSIDIETSSWNGFPSTATATEEVLLITLRDFQTKRTVTLGARPISRKMNSEYIQCKDEEDLLRTFISTFRQMDPDIITGWNLKLFDIAYLCKRIEILLGAEALAKLSPWGAVRETHVKLNNRKEPTYIIEGVAILDLLDLYKKFTFVKRESYKLDHIGEVELNKNKLSNPYDSFNDFWQKDWDLFVEYNIVDVEIVDELEQKLGLIYLAATIAYISKVNFEDVFSPVKTWDSYIKSVLLERNTFVEISDRSFGSADDESIEGAYVMEPIPGMYNWVVSFDATSLYPFIMMMLNMSPETIVGQVFDLNPEKMLSEDFDRESVISELVSKNYSMAANGVCFKRDKLGIMPELVKVVYGGRSSAKKKMLEAKQKYIDTNDIEFKKEARRQDVIQLALKVLLNSLYGASANKWFTFYDTRIAEGITLTGQYIIKNVKQSTNRNLDKVCGTSGHNYVIAGDTDSIYMTLESLVQKFFSNKETSTAQLVDFVDRACKGKIASYLKEGTDLVHKTLNAYEANISFKREAIADRGFWVAKKKYALRVWDNEGVRYEEPDYKVTGIEIVRSSTPAVIREWLRDCMPLIIDNKLPQLREYITTRKAEYMTLDVNKIAKPGSGNNLEEYSSSTTVFKKGCPIHVRGALMYNFLLKEYDLVKKYEQIREGDKLKYVYLKLPNRVKQNIIAYVDRLPAEFGVDKHVDYETQWQKTFMSPIDTIMEAIGWQLEEKSTLESFFE